MLPFLIKFIFYGLGLLIITLPPPVAAVALAISDGYASFGLVRGLQSVPATSEIKLNADEAALKAWASAVLNGTRNDKLQQWFNTSSPCRWEGVQCGIVGGEKRITGISLSDFGLTGIMPSGLGSLRASFHVVSDLTYVTGHQ